MRNLFSISIIKEYFFLVCFPVAGLTACNKFLDKKPDKTTVVISKLDDVQRLLDYSDNMNLGAVPGLLELVADDYYVTDADLESAAALERGCYLWDAGSWHEAAWVGSYQRVVYYANLALDQLPSVKIKENERVRSQELNAAALFYRAWAFYGIAQLYSPVYAEANYSKPGIVLRTSAAIMDRSIRGSVKETYDKITGDLLQAAAALPEVSIVSTRPTKAAAYGALARVYLSMRDYKAAGRFADSCLHRNSQLIDYNSLDSNLLAPFERFNKETVFFSTLSLDMLISMPYAKTDSMLVQSYAPDDLRRGMYFTPNGDGSMQFSGSYEGGTWVTPFNGIATDEMMLIKAESEARAGNTQSALNWLDKLLEKRFTTGKYTPQTAGNATEALKLVLEERRKELVFRGLRWMDLRRLNEEGAGIALKRLFKSQEYSLPAGDARWTMLIPPSVIQSSQIPQNPR